MNQELVLSGHYSRSVKTGVVTSYLLRHAIEYGVTSLEALNVSVGHKRQVASVVELYLGDYSREETSVRFNTFFWCLMKFGPWSVIKTKLASVLLMTGVREGRGREGRGLMVGIRGTQGWDEPLIGQLYLIPWSVQEELAINVRWK